MKKVFALSFVIVAFQILSAQQSLIPQWTFVNPKPFSYDIYSSSFVSDSVGWTAGEDGTINKTSDGGMSWTSQKNSRENEMHNLMSINFFDDKTGWAVGYYGNILRTTDGGENWIAKNIGLNEMLYSVNFVTKDLGFVLGGYGVILKTTDAGVNWTKLPATKAYIYSSQFINQDVGYAVGSTESTYQSTVLKTTDGGKTWNTKIIDVYGKFNACYFVDALLGWVVGDKGRVYKTTDGGGTWEKVEIDTLKYFTAVSFKSELIGCIASQDDSLIYNTTDGGMSWQGVPLYSNVSVTSIKFTKNLVFASGGVGTIFLSRNNGKTWSPLKRSVTSSELTSAFFTSKKNGWAVGWDGAIIKSTDEGITWQLQESNTSYPLNGVFFSDSLNGVACGYGSTMLKTTDGGERWEKILLDSAEMNLISFYFVDSKTGYCCGRDKNYKGVIMITKDGGSTWKILKSPGNDSFLFSMYFKDLLNGWVSGYDLYKTTDGGNSWISVTTGQINPINQIFFCDSLHGWVMGYSMSLKTTDGGNTWIELNWLEYTGNSLYFRDANEGWSISGYGTIYHSINGGDTWKLYSKSYPDLNFITFIGNKGYIVGAQGVILTTTVDEINSVNEKEGAISNIGYNMVQNYPNPFNPTTIIKYDIVKRGNVSLKIYDVLGNEVATLVNEEKQPGNYEVEFQSTVSNQQLASGIYFYQLRAGEFVQTKKMILLR